MGIDTPSTQPRPKTGPVTDLTLSIEFEERDPFEPQSDFNPGSPFYDRFNPPDPSKERGADPFVLIKSAAEEYRFLRYLGAAIRNGEEVVDDYAVRYRLKGNFVIADDGDSGVTTRKEIQVGGDIKALSLERRHADDGGFSWMPSSFSWRLGMDVVTQKITGRFEIGRFLGLEATLGNETRLQAQLAMPF